MVEKNNNRVEEVVRNIPEDSGVSEGLIRHPRDKYCSNFPLAASNNPRYGGEGFSGLQNTQSTSGLCGQQYTLCRISVAGNTLILIIYAEMHTKYRL